MIHKICIAAAVILLVYLFWWFDGFALIRDTEALRELVDQARSLGQRAFLFAAF